MTASAASQMWGRRPADLRRLEQRRRRAARLFAKGASQAEVAHLLGVSAQTASRWHARWVNDGTHGLRASPRSGRPAQLTGRQLAQLRQVILDGAVAAGFDNELWTLSRIQVVVAQRFGVRFHRSHVWRLVRALGFTRWVAEDWPGIVQTPERATRGSASRTSPASG